MPSRQRDAESSKRRILDAAESVFADHGYDAASLAEIGRTANVSAALPAYFFGDKSGLYEAVVQRLFCDRDAALGPVCDRACDELDRGDGLEVGLRTIVTGYLTFLAERTTFVQLMARDALDRDRLQSRTWPRHSSVFQAGVREFLSRVDTAQGASMDADQLLVSLVSLCFFPLEHDITMLASMGYRARSPAFIERRTEHVVDLLLRAIQPVDRQSVPA